MEAFATYVNECSQMKCQLYLIIKDYLVVTERFGADASHSRLADASLRLFGGHGTRCPGKQGQNAPIQNRAIRLGGCFTPLCR